MKKLVLEWLPVLVIVIVGFFVANFFEEGIKSGKINLFRENHVATAFSPVFENYDAVVERERWSSKIDEDGPASALEDLRGEYRGVTDFRIQHTAVHFFGELFFEKFGLDGIKFCDDTFNYGCYHGFMATAASRVDDIRNILPQIDKNCSSIQGERKMANCYHGVGHGILTSFGYDEKSLETSLDECDKFSSDLSNACGSGVFMEYNGRLLLHSPDIFKSNPRPLEGDVSAPCSALPDKYKSLCYFWQAGWWVGALERDFHRIGDLCAGLEKEEYITQCFSGLGKTIVWFQPRMTIRATQICDAMPKKSYSILCRSQGALSIYSRTGDKGLAENMCSDLQKDEKDSCLERLNSTR